MLSINAAATIREKAPLLNPASKDLAERYDAEIWRRLGPVLPYLQPTFIPRAGLRASRWSLHRIATTSPMLDLQFGQRFGGDNLRCNGRYVHTDDPAAPATCGPVTYCQLDLDAVLVDLWDRLHRKSCCRNNEVAVALKDAFGEQHSLMTSAIKGEKQCILRMVKDAPPSPKKQQVQSFNRNSERRSPTLTSTPQPTAEEPISLAKLAKFADTSNMCMRDVAAQPMPTVASQVFVT